MEQGRGVCVYSSSCCLAIAMRGATAPKNLKLCPGSVLSLTLARPLPRVYMREHVRALNPYLSTNLAPPFSLQDLLVRPSQRVMKYSLFLEEMMADARRSAQSELVTTLQVLLPPFL